MHRADCSLANLAAFGTAEPRKVESLNRGPESIFGLLLLISNVATWQEYISDVKFPPSLLSVA